MNMQMLKREIQQHIYFITKKTPDSELTHEFKIIFEIQLGLLADQLAEGAPPEEVVEALHLSSSGGHKVGIVAALCVNSSACILFLQLLRLLLEKGIAADTVSQLLADTCDGWNFGMAIAFYQPELIEDYLDVLNLLVDKGKMDAVVAMCTHSIGNNGCSLWGKLVFSGEPQQYLHYLEFLKKLYHRGVSVECLKSIFVYHWEVDQAKEKMAAFFKANPAQLHFWMRLNVFPNHYYSALKGSKKELYHYVLTLPPAEQYNTACEVFVPQTPMNKHTGQKCGLRETAEDRGTFAKYAKLRAKWEKQYGVTVPKFTTAVLNVRLREPVVPPVRLDTAAITPIPLPAINASASAEETPAFPHMYPYMNMNGEWVRPVLIPENLVPLPTYQSVQTTLLPPPSFVPVIAEAQLIDFDMPAEQPAHTRQEVRQDDVIAQLMALPPAPSAPPISVSTNSAVLFPAVTPQQQLPAVQASQPKKQERSLCSA